MALALTQTIQADDDSLVVLVGLVQNAPTSLRTPAAVVIGPGGASRTVRVAAAHVAGIDLAAPPEPAAQGVDEAGGALLIRAGDDPSSYAAAAARVARAALARGGAHVVLGAAPPTHARRFMAALLVGCQRIRPDRPGAGRISLHVWCAGNRQRDACVSAARLALRVLQARRLGNTPANHKSPAWLAEQAAATTGDAVRVRCRDTAWLQRNRFGGVLAVGQGSTRPPNVTVLEYDGGGASPHVVLVGKGITFDSGGLSLKPAAAMTMMKTDMSGAAAVIGTLGAAAELGLPIRVTGLLACAENMPAASAMRPGDVVRHYGGRTTEVLNTDAEGRLVLADCIAYAADRLRPDLIIVIATLTGSATAGLGRQFAALFSNDDDLGAALDRAGRDSGDRVWRLPLAADYRPAIRSDVADAANTNTDPTVQAGAITAALFLQAFAGALPWAHLDIAGAGRTDSDRPDCRKGATGFGVALLTYFLADRARHRW